MKPLGPQEIHPFMKKWTGQSSSLARTDAAGEKPNSLSGAHILRNVHAAQQPRTEIFNGRLFFVHAHSENDQKRKTHYTRAISKGFSLVFVRRAAYPRYVNHARKSKQDLLELPEEKILP